MTKNKGNFIVVLKNGTEWSSHRTVEAAIKVAKSAKLNGLCFVLFGPTGETVI